VIGLTVVSFGTSLPELVVTMIAGFRNNADLAIANLIGSNIANVLLVLGVAAIIRPLPVRDSTVVSEIPFSLTAAILVGFLANAALFSDYPELSISRLDGCILIFFFFLFILYVYKISRDNVEHDHAVSTYRETRSLIYVAIGIVGLYLGGGWVVDGAVGLATYFGVADAIIGLTIIAVGTSAPELIASAVAAYRGQTDMAVGNVVGSNIFNLLWVLGLTSSLVELPFRVVTNSDLLMVIASSTIIILALVAGRRNTIMRPHGIAFVALYVVYLVFVTFR
jgi:cation:H+ antiporter